MSAVLAGAKVLPTTQDRLVALRLNRWPDRAACKARRGHLFSTEDDPVSLAVAGSLCSGCLVATDCFAVALAVDPDEDAGAWAETTAAERTLTGRRRGDPVAGVSHAVLVVR